MSTRKKLAYFSRYASGFSTTSLDGKSPFLLYLISYISIPFRDTSSLFLFTIPHNHTFPFQYKTNLFRSVSFLILTDPFPVRSELRVSFSRRIQSISHPITSARIQYESPLHVSFSTIFTTHVATVPFPNYSYLFVTITASLLTLRLHYTSLDLASLPFPN